MTRICWRISCFNFFLGGWGRGGAKIQNSIFHELMFFILTKFRVEENNSPTTPERQKKVLLRPIRGNVLEFLQYFNSFCWTWNRNIKFTRNCVLFTSTEKYKHVCKYYENFIYSLVIFFSFNIPFLYVN